MYTFLTAVVNSLPFVRLVLDSLANKGLHFVVDATWLSRVSRSRLQGDTGRTMGWKFKVEWMGMFAQLLDQSLLESGQRLLVFVQWGVDLRRRQVEILAESQT